MLVSHCRYVLTFEPDLPRDSIKRKYKLLDSLRDEVCSALLTSLSLFTFVVSCVLQINKRMGFSDFFAAGWSSQLLF